MDTFEYKELIQVRNTDTQKWEDRVYLVHHRNRFWCDSGTQSIHPKPWMQARKHPSVVFRDDD
jgi:hypothetical protein